LWLTYAYEYTASGKPLLQVHDHDGDGDGEMVTRWTYDAGENLCRMEMRSYEQVFYLY
jgi:hypothetical protein